MKNRRSLVIAENKTGCLDINWLHEFELGITEEDAGKETRRQVADVIESVFGIAVPATEFLTVIGGHHVALIDRIRGERVLMITGTSPDFS